MQPTQFVLPTLVLAGLIAGGGLIAGFPLAAEERPAQVHRFNPSHEPNLRTLGFVYQGRLDEWGAPAQRTYDLQFRLFDTPESGNQIGPILFVRDLPLIDGSFAADLDFGTALEGGAELWLEVAVRAIDRGGDFTVLTPRQRLTGTPYALLGQGAEWSLIGVPVGVPLRTPLVGDLVQHDATSTATEVAQPAGAPQIAPRALTFNGLDHTITASTVPGESFSRQIRIGFSDTPSPDPGDFSDIKVGVGTLMPQATFHVDQPSVPHNGEAALITFQNPNGLQNATGLRIVESQRKTTRGQHEALAAATSLNASGQSGQSSASLASSSGFFARGTLLGVSGQSNPNRLGNASASNTSQGLGGRFISRPASTLRLDGTGQYFVGGAYGEVGGQIDGDPGGGAVAGVIGIDSSTGSAPSWAGYFLGRGHFASLLGIGTTSPTELLDVNGRARVRDLTGGPSDALVTADSNGTLHSISLTGDPNDVLHGDGTFSAAATTDGDWLGAGTGQMRAGFTSDRVAIGTTAGSAKFVVVSNAESPAASIHLQGPGTGGSTALSARVTGTTGGTGVGASVSASASSDSANNTGLRAQADSLGFINEAIEATASGATFRNTGLSVEATGNAARNTAIRTVATGGSSLTIGIFAQAQGGSGTNRAGLFSGDIEVTGTIHTPSDRRLKRGIEDLDGALEILGALRPRSFNYRQKSDLELILPVGRHFGLIAQEVENVLPELVADSAYPMLNENETEGIQKPKMYKSVSYLELIPLLVRGLQEQQNLINAQEARIRRLEAAHESAYPEAEIAALRKRMAELESAIAQRGAEQ